MRTPVVGDGVTAAESINPTIDAGIYKAQTYAVGDYVWYDNNQNGIQDSGELPVANVTVELISNSGTVISTTTTDANGHYVFDNLAPGDYAIKFSDLPENYVITKQSASGSTTANDSNANTTTATTPVFTLGPTAPDMRTPVAADGVTAAELINPTIDTGIYRPQIDLAIVKKLVTAGPYKRGQTVLYELKIRNNGPNDAVGGWSATDLLPKGLTFGSTQPHSDSQGTFTCEAAKAIEGGSSITCANSEPLANGAEKLLYLSVVIDDDAPANAKLRNLTYVSPAANEKAETNPLVKPTFATGDTNSTSTNNDSEASLGLEVEGVPNTGFIGTEAKVILPIGLLVLGATSFIYFAIKQRQ